MTRIDEQIQSAWQSQPVPVVTVSPEQMRQRAARFEATTRRRNRTDLVSFALVLLICIVGVLLVRNVLVQAGGVLLAMWAALGVYSVRRFHALAARPPEALAGACAAWYRQQLEWQRDVALSRPWGLALALPGMALLFAGYIANKVPWPALAVLGALCLFAGIAVIIHGKVLAGQWQREIDLLRTEPG